MPIVAISPLKESIRSVSPTTRNGRGYAWGAVIIGSRIPEIVSRSCGINAHVWLPLTQMILLLGLAMVVAKVCPIKNLAGFILAIAALKFGWEVLAPWIQTSRAIHATSSYLGWGGSFFLSRSIRTVGALLMILTLVGSGLSRRKLFLGAGNWHAQVQPESFFQFRRSLPWTRFSAML